MCWEAARVRSKEGGDWSLTRKGRKALGHGCGLSRCCCYWVGVRCVSVSGPISHQAMQRVLCRVLSLLLPSIFSVCSLFPQLPFPHPITCAPTHRLTWLTCLFAIILLRQQRYTVFREPFRRLSLVLFDSVFSLTCFFTCIAMSN